jgi:hypothetical protein
MFYVLLTVATLEEGRQGLCGLAGWLAAMLLLHAMAL